MTQISIDLGSVMDDVTRDPEMGGVGADKTARPLGKGGLSIVTWGCGEEGGVSMEPPCPLNAKGGHGYPQGTDLVLPAQDDP